MNRKLLLGAAFLLAGGHGAAAADLALPVTDDSDWTGLYATLSAGYSQIKLDGEDFDPDGLNPLPFGDDQDTSGGAILGLGLGYNHDLGGLVIGLEADINYLTNDNTLEMKNTVDADYDWFATGRLRAGYDWDGTLLYATGGVALLAADFEDDQGEHDSQTYVGWTIGGGLERMLSDSWSLRLEGLYVDFPSEGLNLDADWTDVEPGMFIARAGLSWRFFSP